MLRRTKKSTKKPTVKPTAKTGPRNVTDKGLVAHLREKEMWCGSSTKEIHETRTLFVPSGVIVESNFAERPAVAHTVRELVGNAVDAATDLPEGRMENIQTLWNETAISKLGTSCPKLNNPDSLYYSTSLYGFEVINDGNGFNILEKMDLKDKTQAYQPQACVTRMGVGGNMDGEGLYSIGTNGVGLSAAAAFSRLFRLTTVYNYALNSFKRYRQDFWENDEIFDFSKPLMNSKLEVPDIIRRGGSAMNQWIDWDFLGEDPETQQTKDFMRNLRQSVTEIMCEAQLYSTYLTENLRYRAPKFTINWNDDGSLEPQRNGRGRPREIKCSLDTIAGALYNCSSGITVNTTVVPENLKNEKYGKLKVDLLRGELPWKVYIGVAPRTTGFTIINGVRIGKGVHLSTLTKKLVTGLAKHAKLSIKNAADKQRALQDNIVVCLIGRVVKPEFKSQTKEEIGGPRNRWDHQTFSDDTIKSVWDAIGDDITELIDTKTIKTKRIKTTFYAAKYAGRRDSECTMWVAEGASASGSLRTAFLSQELSDFTQAYNGCYDLGGVPMNAVRESKPQRNGRRCGDFVVRRPSEKFLKSEKIAGLIQELGLKYGTFYGEGSHNGESGDKNFADLPYKKVAIIADQDPDGVGKIMPMVVTVFICFWPELVQRGYVTWLSSPIVHVYPDSQQKKPPIASFHTVDEFNAWEKCIIDSGKKQAYYPMWVKGIGSHNASNGEIDNLFREPLRPILLDRSAVKLMHDFYDTDSEPRKQLLLRGQLSNEEIAAECGKLDYKKEITFTQIMRHFAHDQAVDVIRRSLPALESGLYEVQMKTIHAARHYIRGNPKIVAWAGALMQHCGYHHGDMSANGAVINMATYFTGCNNQLTLIRGKGNFGTPPESFKDSASPRYVYATARTGILDAVFPRVDECLYPHASEGDEIYEPDFSCSTIPMVMLNFYTKPAIGYAISIFPRTVESVLAHLQWCLKKRIRSADQYWKYTTKTAELFSDEVLVKSKNMEPESEPEPEPEPTMMRRMRKSKKSTIAKPVKKSKKSVKTTKSVKTVMSILPDDGSNGVMPWEEICKTDFKNFPPPLVPFTWKSGMQYRRVDGKLYTVTSYEESNVTYRGTACTRIEFSGFNHKSYPVHFYNTYKEKEYFKYGEIDAACSSVVLVVTDAWLKTKKSTKHWTAIERAFSLYENANSQLNLLCRAHGFVCLKNYYGVFIHWYLSRLEFYTKRVQYQRVHMFWRILLLQQQQRYAVDYTQLNKVDSGRITEEELNTRLKTAEFPLLNSVRINNPGIVAVDDLEALFTNDKASYSYLLGMTVKQTLKTACAAREKEIDTLTAELKSLDRKDVEFALWKNDVAGFINAAKRDDEIRIRGVTE